MSDSEVSFGAVRLSPHRRELSRDGVPVKVSARGFEILLALLERPGELLTRRELIDRVWRGRVVEDANLAVQISQLRQRLGADGNAIRTEPGSGFRFVGELKAVADCPRAAPEAVRGSIAAGQLPERLGVLIGREVTLDTVELTIASGRDVTLVGPGGIGKTRLAIEVARRSRQRFADGVVFIDLVPLGDFDLIVSALSDIVSAANPQGATTLDGVIRHLSDRSLLILFDNCEHVIDPAARIVSRLLAKCPNVAVLATSREPLHIDGERVLAVPALALASDASIELGKALRFPATQLFVDRVRAMKPSFQPSAAEATTIARMCRRLDGMPLAIELAAGRVSALGVDQVAARLGHGLKILSGGPRSAANRHLTLQATLAWSYDLLTPAEQLAFRRLAVFPHTFTLPAAEAVLASAELSDWDIVDAIDSLVAKSMLVAEDDEGGLHYRMLETTKAYALERLVAAGESNAMSDGLARHTRGVCRDAESDYRCLNSEIWLKRYGSELPNLRASLEWDFSDSGDAQRGLETAAYSWPIWMETALVEGQTWLARAEARLDESTDPAVRALLRSARGWLLPNVRIPEQAENFRQAASAFRDLHDDLRLGEALLGLGRALSLSGKPAQGHATLVEAQALIEKAGTPLPLAFCLQSLALSLHFTGQYVESRRFYNAALELFRSIGAGRRAATVLDNLGDLNYNMGDLDGAIACTGAAVDELRKSGGSGNRLAFALGNLTGFYVARGDLVAACRTAAEALPLLMSSGIAFWFFDHLAALTALVGDCDNAARLLGYSDAMYARQNDYRQPSEQKAYATASEIVNQRIDAARLQELFLVGRSWTTEQAFAHAKEFLQCACRPIVDDVSGRTRPESNPPTCRA